MSHLAGFRGFLQADAYAGYDGLYRGGVTEVACWAHFRRNGIDPQAYLTDVIGKVADDWSASRWDELMPWNWMPPADQPTAQAT